jgi:hypothetical protein
VGETERKIFSPIPRFPDSPIQLSDTTDDSCFSLNGKDMNGHRRRLATEQAAAVFGETDFCPFYLPLPGFASELPEDLRKLCNAGSAHWMPFGQ